VYGHPMRSIMNAFMHLVDDHLVPSIGLLYIYVTF
jgi:hypothetical protein